MSGDDLNGRTPADVLALAERVLRFADAEENRNTLSFWHDDFQISVRLEAAAARHDVHAAAIVEEPGRQHPVVEIAEP